MQDLDANKVFLKQVIQVLSLPRPLSLEQDANLLLRLEQTMGSRCFPSGFINRRTNLPNIKTLNKPRVRQDILRTLRAVVETSDYSEDVLTLPHTRADGETITYKVNNREIAALLSQKMDGRNFRRLFKLAEDKGVFDLAFEHGVPCVTLCAGSQHMTRKWPRDHSGMAALIRAKYPDYFWPGLEAVAKSYFSAAELKAFERVLRQPRLFNENKGIAHVFWLNAKNGRLTRDKGWKMHQRIESHAEYLNVLAAGLAEVLQEESPVKFSDSLVKAVVYFTHYLFVLGPSPQTCGPWEEIPFAKGSNWDSASVIGAFSQVISLLERLRSFPDIYRQFINAEKKLLKKFNLPALMTDPRFLKSFNKKGLKQIQNRYLDEFRGLTKRVDSSSVMLTASGLDLSPDNNLREDIRRHLEILRRFEKNLVKDFGALRYNAFEVKINNKSLRSCDSYLNLNSDILLDNHEGGLYLDKRKRIKFLESNGADASAVEVFEERNRGFSEETSAQWGLPLSYAAIAYGKLAQKLLRRHQQTQTLTAEEKQLLKNCLNGEEEFIKRSYGNVTGSKSDGTVPYKANGDPAIMWKKPEAYQSVTAADGKPRFIPGVNSHLGWDAAKCWEASVLYLENLDYLENHKIFD